MKRIIKNIVVLVLIAVLFMVGSFAYATGATSKEQADVNAGKSIMAGEDNVYINGILVKNSDGVNVRTLQRIWAVENMIAENSNLNVSEFSVVNNEVYLNGKLLRNGVTYRFNKINHQFLVNLSDLDGDGSAAESRAFTVKTDSGSVDLYVDPAAADLFEPESNYYNPYFDSLPSIEEKPTPIPSVAPTPIPSVAPTPPTANPTTPPTGAPR